MYIVQNENNSMAGCLCTDSFDSSKPYHTMDVGQFHYTPPATKPPSSSVAMKIPSTYEPFRKAAATEPILPPTCGIVITPTEEPKQMATCGLPAMAMKQPMYKKAMYKQPSTYHMMTEKKTPAFITRRKRSAGYVPYEYKRVAADSPYEDTEANRPFDYFVDFGTAYGVYEATPNTYDPYYDPQLQNYYTYNNIPMDPFDPFYIDPLDTTSLKYQDALKTFYDTIGYPNFTPSAYGDITQY